MTANSPDSSNVPVSPSRRSFWMPALSLILLLWVAWRMVGGETFDLKAFMAAIVGMDPGWLALSIVLISLTYVGRAIRWLVMLRPVSPESRLGPVLEATVIGFCGAILLGRAGEFIRPYLIAKQENVSVTSQIAIWLLERLTDLLAVLLIFGWALSSIDQSVAQRVGPEIRWVLEFGGRVSLIVGLVSILILAIFRYFPNLASGRVREAAAALPEGARERIVSLAESFAAGMNVTRDSRTLGLVLFYSVAEWLFIAACYYSILQSFAPTAGLTVRDSLVLLGMASFGSIVQVPGIGGGMQIVSILVLNQMFGVSIEDATAIATMLWGIGLAIVVPPGLVLAARRGLSWTRLRTAQERPA